MRGTARRTLVSSFSLSSSLFSSSKQQPHLTQVPSPLRVSPGFKPHSTTTTMTISTNTTSYREVEEEDQSKAQQQQPTKHNPLLEKLKMRQLKGSASRTPKTKTPSLDTTVEIEEKIKDEKLNNLQEMNQPTEVVSSFEDLGLSEEVIGALMEMGIFVPTENQCVLIPAILEGKNVVFIPDTKSGSIIFGCILPVIQLLRRDEASLGIVKPRHPRAVVLCPMKELSEQVYHVTKSISSHVPIRSTLVSGGECLRTHTESSDNRIDMVIGTCSSVLQQIEKGDMFYDDIKYLVLDDTDSEIGFGREFHKFLDQLKGCASKSDGKGFQIVLVFSSITKMKGSSSLLEQIEKDNAGNMAGILLEMDQTELFHLVESPDALKKKIASDLMSMA